MVTLFILCGFPFAGKSTLVKALVNRYRYSLVGIDEINTERGLGQTTGRGLEPKEWKEIYDEAYKRIGEYLSQGKSVVYDATNFTKEQRHKPRDIAKEYCADSKVIFVDVPKEKATRRWQENRGKNNRFDVRDEDFAQVVNNFQRPAANENVLVFDQKIPIDEWINKNFE